jgi:hypothetical protein
MALLPTRPLPFSQPSPDVTAAGGHPHRNLGKYLHLGTAASDVKAKGIALKAAIDQKIAELGKQVAADTAAPSA